MKNKHSLVGLGCLFLIFACKSREFNASEVQAAKLEVLSKPELLDVAYPPFTQHNLFSVFAANRSVCATRCPVILIVHGGGFVGGDKTDKEDMNVHPEDGKPPYFVRGLVSRFVEKGYAVVNVNYRLSSSVSVNGDREDKRGSYPYPAAYEDASKVADYVRDLKNASSSLEPLQHQAQKKKFAELLATAKVSIDPNRIGAIGFSAGGAIVGYLALNRKVDAVVDSSGIADFYDEGTEAIRQIEARYSTQTEIDYFTLRYYTTAFNPPPEFRKSHEMPSEQSFAEPYKFHWLANWFRTENTFENTPGMDPNWKPGISNKGPKPPLMNKDELLKKYDRASLLRRTELHKEAPFLMFVHGRNDPVVPIWHAKKFYAKVLEANVGMPSAELANRYRFQTHNGKHDFGASVSEESANYDAMFGFFKAGLK